jgi:hypothetical protein
MELEVIAEDAYFQPYEEPFQVIASKKATVEVLNKKSYKPNIVVERVTPESTLGDLLTDRGITKKMLVENKSKFSKVLYNYYREVNIQEGFSEFLQKVLKKLR